MTVLLAAIVVAGCSNGGGGGTSPGGGVGTNIAPVFTSSAPTTATEAVAYAYQATATDADSDPVTFTLIVAPTGMSVVSGTGLVSWTPGSTQVGTHNVTLQASDGTDNTNQSWVITVSTAGNNAPVFTSTAGTSATEGQPYSYQATATDADADPLTYTLIVAPTGMTVGSTTGLIAWTPTNAQIGTHNVTLQVSDGIDNVNQSWVITVVAGSVNSSPSGGSGGTYPGNQTRTVSVSGLGNQNYYLYIPNSYNPANPMPIMWGFHGSAGSPSGSDAAAQQVRSYWQSVADSGGFIVLAQVATGSTGGWIPSNTVAVFNEISTDVMGAYNIEQKRIHAWGFSAGGHLIHGLALANANLFASYGVSAGALQALAGTGAPAAAARKIPCDLHIGSTDTIVPPSVVQADRQTFISAGWTLSTDLFYTEFTGGHTFTTTHLSEIWTNIGGFSLP
ncbi:MAG: CE1 family esterase [Planctomycetota bacterium]